jgi:type IV pilus modification protein PilV
MFKEQFNHLKQKNNNQGFTLIEILIATSIFAIGFLAVAAMQISASKSTRRAVEVTEATAIASDQMERLMSLPFDDGELVTGTTHSDTQGNYNLQWEVTFSDVIITGTTTVDAKTINLNVSWDRVLSSGSSQRSVNIDFIKPNPIYIE